MLRGLRHIDVPQERASQAVETDHVGVIGVEEDTVAEQRNATVGTQGRVAGDSARGSARP